MGEPLAQALLQKAIKEAEMGINATAVDDENATSQFRSGVVQDIVGAVAAGAASATTTQPNSTTLAVGNSTALAGVGADGEAAKPIPLPNEFLPSFWALLTLAIIVVAHSLLWFAQRWSVKFRAFVQYRVDSRGLHYGSHLLVEPHEHQGRADIVRIQRDADNILYFMFQHQRYELTEATQEVHRHISSTTKNN
jgi:hypothetical protein